MTHFARATVHHELIPGHHLQQFMRVESRQSAENRIPIEMVRAALTDAPLPRDYKSSWRFYGEVG